MIEEIKTSHAKWVDLTSDMYFSKRIIRFGIGEQDGNTFEMQCLVGCRDNALDHIRHKVGRVKSLSPIRTTSFALVANKCPLKYFKSALQLAQQLLNDMEKQLKWKRTKFTIMNKVVAKTKTGELEVRKCSTGTKFSNTHIAMLEGSRCWVQNPFFIHILLGAVKQCFYHKHAIEKYKVKTLDELFKLFSNTSHTSEHIVAKGSGYSSAHLWVPLLKDRRKVFGTFKPLDLYKYRKTLSLSNAYGVGINYLLERGTRIPIYNKDGKSLGTFVTKWKKTQKE